MVMSKEWSFITETSDGKIDDKGTRRKIRQHAMRAYRSSDRQARVQAHLKQSQAITRTVRRSTDQSKNQNTREGANHGSQYDDGGWPQVARIHEPGSGVDPFAVTSLPQDPEVPELLNYFITTIAPQLVPLYSVENKIVMDSFLSQAVQEDYGAICSILFHSSLHAEKQVGRLTRWKRSTLLYRGETIRLLGERLQGNAGVTSDSSICMVAFLAASGNITGDVAAEEDHWNALRVLIKLRGGTHKLGRHGSLGLIIHVGDNIQATISRNPLHLMAPDIADNIFVHWLPPTELAALQDPGTLDFLPQMQGIMSLYRQLSVIQSVVFNKAGTNMEMIVDFTQLCVAAEQRLLTMIAPRESSSSEGLLYMAAHSALLSCSSLMFRDLKLQSTTFTSLQARLKQDLAVLNASNKYATFDNGQWAMLIWVLWIGGLTSMNQKVYVSQMPHVLQFLGVETWLELRMILCQYLWSSRLEGPECWSLCSSIGFIPP